MDATITINRPIMAILGEPHLSGGLDKSLVPLSSELYRNKQGGKISFSAQCY